MSQSVKIILWGMIIGFISCTHQDGTEPADEPLTIMALLAHPDDESAVAPVLARYASEGMTVYLVLAADGRYGVEEHAGIPPGEALAAVREKESACASEILGIKPPVFLGYHDGFGLMGGLGEYFRQTSALKEDIKRIIDELKPDAILTFGPDGDTGHPDHRAIGDLTTEVVLREGWVATYPLYYIGWTREKEVWIPQGSTTSLNYVDKSYLNVQISYNEADRDKYFQSLYCYKSQFTEADVEKWIDAELKDTTFTMYFREFTTGTQIKNSLHPSTKP
jgi:N-acetylglucosamine malate deacetylase 2